MAFVNLSKNLQEYCVEFLQLRDALSLSQTSKLFKKLLDNHSSFWVSQCISISISFDMTLLSPFYQEIGYEEMVKKRIASLNSAIWLRNLKAIYRARTVLCGQLDKVVNPQETRSFLEYLDSSLKEPSLPLLKLKKDTTANTTITFFQNKLLEVFANEDKVLQISLISPYSFDKMAVFLKNVQSSLNRQLVSSEKDALIRIRWCHSPYIYEGSITDLNVSTGNQIKLQKSTNLDIMIDSFELLEKTYYGLYLAFNQHCKVTRKYLEAFEKDPYLLLAEYCTRWNSYSASILEFESTLGSLAKKINEVYQQNFPNYPQSPEFSIWRLMAKIWFREVYSNKNLAKSLDDAFKYISKNVLNEMAFAVCEALSESAQDESKTNEFKLPKHAYVNIFQTTYTGLTGEQVVAEDIGQVSEEFFKKRRELLVNLLKEYVQMILDISLNEITVHSLKRTDVKFNYPYQELETIFLIELRTSYMKIEGLLQNYPTIFRHIFEKNSNLINQIFPKSTQVRSLKMQIDDALTFMSHFTRRFIASTKSSDIVQVKTNSQNAKNLILSFLEEAYIDVQNQANTKNKNFENNANENHHTLDEKNIQSNESLSQLKIKEEIAPRLLYLILLKYPKFQDDYQFWIEKNENIIKAISSDAVVKQINQNKKIPNELSAIESLFYDIDRDTDLELVTNILLKKEQRQPSIQDNCP